MNHKTYYLVKMASWLYRRVRQMLPTVIIQIAKKIWGTIQSKWLILKNPAELLVAIDVGGGVGDYTFFQIWAKEFYKNTRYDVSIDVFGGGSIHYIFKNIPFVRTIYNSDIFPFSNAYDIKLKIRHYPIILHYNKERVNSNFSEIIPLIDGYKKIYRLYAPILDNDPFFDGMWARLMIKYGFKRKTELYMQNDHFPHESELYCSIPLEKKSFDALDKYGLRNSMFITVHNGSDTSNARSIGDKYVSNYPIEKFSELCRIIKEKYPSVMIVQLGHPKSSEPIKNVDLNLIGKSSLDEAFAILKYSTLHIDGDSGFVHVNASLMGRSVVVYGPSPMKYLAYEENVNISKNICESCMWDSPDWRYQCLAGHDEPICMTSINPDEIFERCETIISNALTHKNALQQSSCCCWEDLKSELASSSNVGFLGKYHNSLLDFFERYKATVFVDARNEDVFEVKKRYFTRRTRTDLSFELVTGFAIPARRKNFSLIIIDNSYFAEKNLWDADIMRMLKPNGHVVYTDKNGCILSCFRLVSAN